MSPAWNVLSSPLPHLPAAWIWQGFLLNLKFSAYLEISSRKADSNFQVEAPPTCCLLPAYPCTHQHLWAKLLPLWVLRRRWWYLLFTHVYDCNTQNGFSLGSISITWDLVKRQTLKPHLRPTNSESLKAGPRNLHSRTCRWFSWMLHFEKHLYSQSAWLLVDDQWMNKFLSPKNTTNWLCNLHQIT